MAGSHPLAHGWHTSTDLRLKKLLLGKAVLAAVLLKNVSESRVSLSEWRESVKGKEGILKGGPSDLSSL